MSAVAALFNVPSTRDELNTWAFAHAAHHRDINRVIYELAGVQLVEYPLDPIDTHDSGVWTYQHQVMHQQFEPLLGIAGFDLLDVDLNNRSEFSGWIWLNAQSHYQAAALLNMG